MARTWALEAEVVSDGVWTDITEYASDLYWSWGAAADQDTPQTGQLQVALENDTGRFTPENTASPYTGRIRPGIGVRLRVEIESFSFTLFTGVALRWEPSFPNPGDRQLDTVNLDVADLGEQLRHVPLNALHRTVTERTDPDRYWYLDGTAGSQPDVIVGAPADLETVEGSTGGAAIVSGAAGSYEATWTADGGFVRVPAVPATVGSSATWAVSVWFSGDSGSIIAGCGNPISTGTGRSFPVGQNNAAWMLHSLGSGATLKFAHGNGTTNEQFDSGYAVGDGETHWALVVRTSSTLKIYVDGVLRSTGTVSITPKTDGGVYLGGYMADRDTDSIILDNQFDGLISDVAFWTSDPTANLPGDWDVAAWYDAGDDGFAGNLPGAWIGRMLDLAGWSSTDRALSTGTTPIGAADTSAVALEQIRQVGFSDLGVAWADVDGTFRFRGRADRWANDTTPVQTFTDTGTGSGTYDDGIYDSADPYVPDVSFSRIQFAFDTVKLASTVHVSDTIGTQTGEDAAARALYGRRIHAETTLSTDTEDTRGRVAWLLNNMSSPRLRIPSLSVDRLSDTEAAAMCGLRIGDLVTVTFSPDEGDTITKDVRVWGMRHSVSGLGQAWAVTVDLLDAELDLDVGVYDQSTYGNAVYGY